MVSEELPENVGSPYWNLVSVTAWRADGSQAVRVTGAVFGSTPHVVSINNYLDLFAFKPEGSNYILSFRNEDRPGAISEVASPGPITLLEIDFFFFLGVGYSS